MEGFILSKQNLTNGGDGFACECHDKGAALWQPIPATGISPTANIPALAAGEQAPRRSRLVCEPHSARFAAEMGSRASATTKGLPFGNPFVVAPATGIEPITTP